MSERTYLTISLKEKDHVKTLGARWDLEAHAPPLRVRRNAPPGVYGCN
ncbi:DUF5710 domain-containing protein [Burkholderia pseudomallei]